MFPPTDGMYSLENCAGISGTAAVIDVLRAYTTAAFAFHAGAAVILLAGTPQEAFALRAKDPGLLLVGEVEGRPIPGFDLGNSPSRILNEDLAGRRLVLRSSAGVQGVLRCHQARQVLAVSLVNLAASVRHMLTQFPQDPPGWVATGWGENDGLEDLACAHAGTQLLRGVEPDWAAVRQAVKTSSAARKFLGGDPHFPSADLDAALEINRFDFAMVVRWHNGICQLERVPGTAGYSR